MLHKQLKGNWGRLIRTEYGGRCVGQWRLAFACGLASLTLGTTGCQSPVKQEPDFGLMTQAWNTIQQQYVNPSSVSTTEMMYGAIGGMVDALGDTGHSTFLTPDMVDDLKKTEKGEFKGVGIEIQVKGGKVVVVAPFDGSPAQRAGVQPGDIILKVAGEDIADWPLNRVVDKIGGRSGTKINLTLQDPHTGRTRELTLTRTSIKIHHVTWHPLPGTTVAHLRLASFDNGATRDLRRALEEIRRQGLNGIILDLRNNPGGLLDEAITVASQFLPDGNVLLAKDGKGKTTAVPVQKGGCCLETPVVVLVNEGTASAAEIVAAALQDSHRAQLVGDTTFGTGTVLQEFRLSDGSALLLAVEEWLTPNGRSFWHKGLTPEFVVPLPQEATPLIPASEDEMTPTQLHSSSDSQLLSALNLVGGGRKAERSRALKDSEDSGR